MEAGVAGPDGTTGWDRLDFDAADPDLASDVLGHGADVIVESPADLRDEVVRRLRGLAGGAA